MHTTRISDRRRDRTWPRAGAPVRALVLAAGCVWSLSVAAVAGDYGGWVYGGVGYSHDFIPDYQSQTAANDLVLTYTPPSLTAGVFPDADVEGHAASGTLKGRAHAKYDLKVGDLVEEYGTFTIASTLAASYRELLTISGGVGFDGKAATYTLEFGLTGVGSETGWIDRQVSYLSRLYSDGHYFIKPGADGAPDTEVTEWWLYGSNFHSDTTYIPTCTMTIHGVTLGQAVDVEVELALSVSAYVQRTWLPSSGEGTMDFLSTAQLNSLTVLDPSGNPLATFNGSGGLVSGNPGFTMHQAVPEPGATGLVAGLALVAFAIQRRSKA